MTKKKITLEQLRVESFATNLTKEQMNNTKGGIYIIQGQRYVYRNRWTGIEIRTEVDSQISNR